MDTDEKVGNEIVTVIKDEDRAEWLEMNNITNFIYETILIFATPVTAGHN